MPDRLSLHAPILVNTIGHCAGAVIFGIFLYLLALDWRRDPRERSPLPGIAALLALLWNITSLVGLATPAAGAPVADAVVAAGFAILSFLPAVLLHISLRSSRRALWIAGYLVSAAAAVLHWSDLATAAPRFHSAGILVVTIGFGTLTAVSVVGQAASGARDGSGARLAAAMVVFLFALSFVHFENADHATAWSGEAVLHHAGIPLALFVLLQDYRFLLLDAFIRIIADAALAAVAVAAAIYSASALSGAAWRRDPFRAALLFVSACLLLTLFASVRTRIQRWFTRAVFLRAGAERVTAILRNPGALNEAQYLAESCRSVASFLSASRFELIEQPAAGRSEPAATVIEALSQAESRKVPPWVHAIAPFPLARGDSRLLLLGSRAGGRRYLSEDLRALERFAAVICEQVERIRSSEMQKLVAQAELRALQGQMNPHFLFNSLNTLYGTIDRENAAARKLVANLATLLRYVLASDRAFIALEQEIRIVRAYLEIEQLRLGPKLQTSVEIDDEALKAEVPVLSIQPLVENAVRHGVASRREAGFVNLSIRVRGESITVEVVNSGPFPDVAQTGERGGIGLANVRKRLALCYGPASGISIESGPDRTSVRFAIPAGRAIAASA